MKNLTLLIPVKKEKESLKKFLNILDKYNYKKILIIDKFDNSDYNFLKKFDNIKYSKSKKKGYGAALIEGINQIKTKYFCIINADGSMDPKEIKYMMNLTNKNSFIFGSRYLKNAGSDDDTIITYLGNKIFH